MDEKDLGIQANSFVLNQEEIKEKAIFADAETYVGIEIAEKNVVVEYMRSFQPTWTTSDFVVDMVENQKIKKVDNIYSDGVYEWSESDIYHFEKYNMPLVKEFIKHILN